MRNSIDHYSTSYDNIVVLGDFNSEPYDPLDEFCNLYNMKNLITVPTCFKSLESPSCIDLIITNRPRSFMDSMAFETGVSDFHKLTLSVLKMIYKKQPLLSFHIGTTGSIPLITSEPSLIVHSFVLMALTTTLSNSLTAN